MTNLEEMDDDTDYDSVDDDFDYHRYSGDGDDDDAHWDNYCYDGEWWGWMMMRLKNESTLNMNEMNSTRLLSYSLSWSSSRGRWTCPRTGLETVSTMRRTCEGMAQWPSILLIWMPKRRTRLSSLNDASWWMHDLAWVEQTMVVDPTLSMLLLLLPSSSLDSAFTCLPTAMAIVFQTGQFSYCLPFSSRRLRRRRPLWLSNILPNVWIIWLIATDVADLMKHIGKEVNE